MKTGTLVLVNGSHPCPETAAASLVPVGPAGDGARMERRAAALLEPWHFRYVGIPHAEIMERLSLTLEEYLGMLRRYPFGEKPFAFRSGAFRFAVAYLPDSEAGAVPPHCLRSGDNDGGIILTTWDPLEKEVSCI